MLKGVNDSDKDAQSLIDLIRHFPSLVNLIPFNPWPGTFFESSPTETIQNFSQILSDGGVSVTVRWPRGRDIHAACGQLRSDSEKDNQSSAQAVSE